MKKWYVVPLLLLASCSNPKQDALQKCIDEYDTKPTDYVSVVTEAEGGYEVKIYWKRWDYPTYDAWFVDDEGARYLGYYRAYWRNDDI